MGIFGKFGKTQRDLAKEEIVETPWHVLSEMEQLEEISEVSQTKPVAIFKHSTRCGISRMVLRNFESSYSLKDEQLKLYYLDLLAHRNISDEVAARFQVLHQSPQLIVIKNNTAVAHAAHHSIQAAELSNFV
ncbi:MAG: bacillithiol system redox-active protein YtxJ [Marinirhabdus sp.]|nr:bacillithiol system redox-active protein YtxJ [Marinirhabdus sp.]